MLQSSKLQIGWCRP